MGCVSKITHENKPTKPTKNALCVSRGKRWVMLPPLGGTYTHAPTQVWSNARTHADCELVPMVGKPIWARTGSGTLSLSLKRLAWKIFFQSVNNHILGRIMKVLGSSSQCKCLGNARNETSTKSCVFRIAIAKSRKLVSCECICIASAPNQCQRNYSYKSRVRAH